MKAAIIASKKDPAGVNIASFLDDVHMLDILSIDANNIDKEIDADLFIFATRHQSKEKVASLCVHTPGNWDRAEYGGADKKLCIAPAKVLKYAYNKLLSLNLDINKTLEVTHHGPLIDKPCLFIEIGSFEENWKDEKYGKIIADVIKSVIENIDTIINSSGKIAFGIGGLHYASNFNKIMERTDIAVGHICPKYMLEKLDKDMIRQAMDRTFPKADFALLDWKGLGKEKQRIVDMLDKLGIQYERTDKILR